MRRRREKSKLVPYFSIWESELEKIARESASRPNLETGGELYGYRTQAGRCIVHFATGPGQNAVHQRAHFAQDVDVLLETAGFLQKTFGAQLVGRWHSHHFLSLNEPSPGDEYSTRSLCRRNNLSRFVEIITTHEVADPAHQPCHGGLTRLAANSPSNGHPAPPFTVRINAFDHTKPQAGRYVRCPIKVVAGISPIRHVGISRALVIDGYSDWFDFNFPSERIGYESLEDSSDKLARGDTAAAIPRAVQGQLARLPRVVNERVTVHRVDDSLVVELPFDGACVVVELDSAPPHLVHQVLLRTNETDELRDVSTEITADDVPATLDTIHKAASAIIEVAKSETALKGTCEPDGMDETSADVAGSVSPFGVPLRWTHI